MMLLDHNHSQPDVQEAEAVIKEARRRRRRRSTFFGIITLILALVAGGIGLALSRNGPGKSLPTTTGPTSSPGTGSPQPKSAPASSLAYTAAAHVGAAGTTIWTGNGVGIYLTDNGGSTWTTITPPILEGGVDPGYRIGSIVGIGVQDLWMPVGDVPGLAEDIPGLIPPGSASVRGSGIERSTDGGKTWQFTALPGCLQICGANVAVSFPDVENGFASIGPGLNGTYTLFSTEDGGASWARVASLPGSGGAQIVFTSGPDGWDVNGTDFTGGGGEDGPLYRTTNGGASWQPAPELPTTDLYEPPQFFGGQDGVVLGRPEGGTPTRRPTVFTTVDGGTTWTAHSTPSDKATATWTQNGNAIPFSASARADWVLFVGPKLYATVDSGHHWTTSVPNPTWKAGEILSMVFSSADRGWAVATKPGCPDPYPTTEQEAEECEDVLMATVDAGKHWSPQNP